MRKIEGAIFDLDGTLVDSMWLWNGCYERVLRTFFGVCRETMEPAMLEKMDTAPITIGIPMLCEYYQSKIDPEEIFADLNRTFHQFYSNEVQLKEGVKELLEHLKGKGVRMCIASASAPEMVNAALRHCGINHYFIKVLTCDDVGRSKEYPDVYEAALKLLGTSKESTWVFEDAIVAVRTSHAMGLHTVGIYDDGQKGQEEICALSDIYLAQGESHQRLVSFF